MYSRIPMPHFEWASDDMKYHLIFFPWVGAVIGVLEYALYYLYEKYQYPHLALAALALAIPLVVTGGFHLDGYMDVTDALSSWQTKEKRLEIMKDPHIGAFSVINLVTLGLIMFAAILMMTKEAFITWCFSFFVVRCLSGICVVRGKKAKEDGLLHTEAKTASDNIVFIALIVELIACFVYAFYVNPYPTIALIVVSFLSTVGYIRMAYKNFGGITGDLAGWFVVNTEMLIGAFVMALNVLQ